MDDRELEARLRAHLHRRFDSAQPSSDLGDTVARSIGTPTMKLSRGSLRFRAAAVGWSLAVVAALALVAVVGLNLSPRVVGPGIGVSPSPSVGPATRTFMVLPPGSAVPSKADSVAASDVLAARLRVLGVGTFSISGGYAMRFDIAAQDGPSDDLIRSVLGATGEVSFVPLPPAEYGDQQGSGPLTAVVGQPLPKQEPALFGREGIASVGFGDGSSVGNPSPLEITLTPAAGHVLAVWTTAHVGEIVAILVDSKVVAAPVTMEPLVRGSITIEPASNGPFLADGVAVLVGGVLPASWRPAEVVKPISRDDAINAALSQGPGTVDTADLDAQVIGGSWRAVWTIVMRGAYPYHCPLGGIGPAASECGSHPAARITVDARGANVLSVELLSE